MIGESQGLKCSLIPAENGRQEYNPEYYPRRCVTIHAKQNPQIFSVLPVDTMQLNQSTTLSEGGDTPPWRRPIVSGTVLVRVGEVLQLNVDAFDPNEDDDVDIGLASDSALPPSAVLGPRHCCTDDFSSCQPIPMGYTDEIEVNTTRCNVNMKDDPPGLFARTTCVSTCERQAVPRPCRAGKSTFFVAAFRPFCLSTREEDRCYDVAIEGIMRMSEAVCGVCTRGSAACDELFGN